jgi:hypothetical protein
MLGHTAGSDDGESPCSRVIGEFQAESAAYPLALELELSEWGARGVAWLHSALVG